MNIIVDLNYPIKDGSEIIFRSPVDCSQVTGLLVNYQDNGNCSKEFAFADAHGNNVGDIDHLFAENVAVKVILDVTTGMAFVQNADTNAYLEGRFAELEAMIGTGGGGSGNVYELSQYLNRVHCPVPQLPANEETDADFNLKTFADFGEGYHSYFDDLLQRYPNYLVRELMGKDASETLPIYRYTLGKHYWAAYCKENYPRMYAWKNGNNIIYSQSVAPRIGDVMYTTPYIGNAVTGTTTTDARAVLVPGKRFSHSKQTWSADNNTVSLVFPFEVLDISHNVEVNISSLAYSNSYTSFYHSGVSNTIFDGTGEADRAIEPDFTVRVTNAEHLGKRFGCLFFKWDGTDGVLNDAVLTVKDSTGEKTIEVVIADDSSGARFAETAIVDAEITAISATNRSRTINGIEYVRYESGDIEPTLVYLPGHKEYPDYTKNPLYKASGTCDWISLDIIPSMEIQDNNGTRYFRYPYGDLDKINDTTPDKVLPSTGKPKIHMTIISNEHGGGDEPGVPAVVVARFIRDLCEGRHSANPVMAYLRDNVQITVIPVVNPHGLNKHPNGTHDGYHNANSVNINRNYDTPGWDYCYNNKDIDGNGKLGEYPGSENETQYVMNTMADSKPVVAMSLHTIGGNLRYGNVANRSCMYQGQNPNGDYTQKKIDLIGEDMISSYNLGFIPYDPLKCPPDTTAKSPSYITQCGAYGGIVEMQILQPFHTEEEYNSKEARFTSVVMEQNYSLLLKCIAMWLSDYLENK